MATKSNSNLLIIISIAILLFVSAIIWKNSKEDNSEQIYIKTIAKDEPIQKKKRDVIEDTYNLNDSGSGIPLNENLQENHKKEVESKMHMALMYKTPDKILEAITYYKSIGDTEKENQFIDYLLEQYPDYEVK